MFVNNFGKWGSIFKIFLPIRKKILYVQGGPKKTAHQTHGNNFVNS